MTIDESQLQVELLRILNKVFSLQVESPANTQEELMKVDWDSLKIVQIALELEDSFNFEISDSEIEKLRNYDITVQFLRSKLSAK